jgi:hypothetical protein
MDQTTMLLALIIAAGLGLMATLAIVRRERRRTETEATDQQFAVSTEGQKRCPACGMGNLVTDATCVSCGQRLPG